MLAASDQRLWLRTPAGVIEADERTGTQIGPPIAVEDTVNLAVAVGPSAVWLAGQPDSSSGGNVTPYDLATHRPLRRADTDRVPHPHDDRTPRRHLDLRGRPHAHPVRPGANPRVNESLNDSLQRNRPAAHPV